MINTISMDDLHSALESVGSRLNQDAVVIDVRTPEEFSEGHVPGSKNIPVQEIADHISEIKKFKDIYIYCLAGGRVVAASQILQAGGIQNMNCVFSGGFPNWAARGFEIEFD